MSQHIFPLLNVAEITNTCQEMFPDLKVTEEDFINPKAENIRALYVYLLESVTNCNVEVIFSPQVENIDHNDLLSYPELHVESIPPVNILFAMKSVMQSAGISNFQMKDLTTPKPKRVARIMSAFINFAHHSNNIGELFEEVLGEIEAKREAYHALLEKGDELQTKINDIKSNHAAEDAEIQELKQKIESDTDLISKEKKEAVVIQRQIAESDASLASKNSRIEQLRQKIGKQRDECGKMERDIVQSPERKHAEQEQMRRQLVAMRQTQETRRRHLLELREQEPQRQQLIRDVEHLMKLLADIIAESGKERDIMKEVDDLVEKMAHLREQLRDLTHSNDQQKRVFATKQQKMSKMAIKHRQQIEALQYQLEEHKKTLEEHARRCKENDVLTLKFTEEKRNVDQALAIQKKSHEKVLAKYMQQYHELIAAVKQYHNTLLDAINS